MRSCFWKLLIPAILAATIAGCGGGAPGDPAAARFVAQGGTGRNGAGGNGGTLVILSEGNTRVLKTGSVTETFAMPDPAGYAFGTTPHGVVHDETIQLDTDTVPAGLYCRSGDPRLYRGDGDGDTGNDPVVTGLHIAKGATLSVPKNIFYDWLPTYDFGMSLDGDLVVDGTLAVAPGVTNINVASTAGSIIIGAGGRVSTRGADGGWIALSPQKDFYNAGTVDASGADNPAGDGNDSGGAYITAYGGGVYSSGTFMARGGNGRKGGNANGVVLYGGAAADPHNWPAHSTGELDPVSGGIVLVRGSIRCEGGDGSDGSGGGYGILDIYGFGGRVLVAADINLRGGNGTGPGSVGGSPIGVAIYAYGLAAHGAGIARISGNIDLSGGSGATGGDAGYFWIETVADENGAGPDVELLGFGTIALDGGDGTTAGGNGCYRGENASAVLTTIAPRTGDSRHLPAGSVTNETNIRARGGRAVAGGTGGAGGIVQLACAGWGAYVIDGKSVVTNSGDIDTSGGDGARGGNARVYDGAAGSPPGLLLSGWRVINAGSLTSQGGNGVTLGGNGGDIYLLSRNSTGVRTVNTGPLSVTGGKGATPGRYGSVCIDY